MLFFCLFYSPRIGIYSLCADTQTVVMCGMSAAFVFPLQPFLKEDWNTPTKNDINCISRDPVFLIRIEIPLLHLPIGPTSKNLKQSSCSNQPHHTVQQPLSESKAYLQLTSRGTKALKALLSSLFAFPFQLFFNKQADLLSEGYETTWRHLLIHKTVSAGVGDSVLTKELLDA